MELTYYDFAKAVLPDDRIKGVFEPREHLGLDRRQFREQVDQTLRNSHFVDRLVRHKRMLILVDDITRETPVDEILPSVLGLADQAGIKKEDTRILVALGTHRPLSQAEKIRKFGLEVVNQVDICSHDYKKDVVQLGRTSQGTPIELNRLVTQYDFMMGIGLIVPHRVSGFSGGGKIVQPGISGEITTGLTHWRSAEYEGQDIMGKIANPVREEIDEVAHLAGLKYVYNVVVDKNKRPIRSFAGDFQTAYREGAAFSCSIYGVKAQRSKIVITDSHPADIEMWQASKGVYCGDLLLEAGGILILVTPCYEGVGVEFGKQMVEFGYRGYAEVKELVASGRIQNLILAAHLAHVGRVIKEKGQGIIISPGMDDETCRKLGFLPASGLSAALELADSLVGKEDITVARFGGELLPIID